MTASLAKAQALGGKVVMPRTVLPDVILGIFEDPEGHTLGLVEAGRLPHNRRMRRADRLFRIVQLLRRRRTVVTAAQIAAKLEISERTVYRDVRDLIAAGTPIDGEAGVGYRLQPGYDLPPLMFDREEIQALVLGARIVAQFGDPALARASESILSKVAGVLPKDLEPLLADTRLFVPHDEERRAVGGRARRRARGARRAAADCI